MSRRERTRGSAIVEFAFTGIPLMFVWISIVQMSIGMWHYHTIQYAVKAAGQYAAVHGSGFVAAGNAAKQVKDTALVLKTAAIGIPANEITVTFTAGTSTPITCRLDNCITNATTWPPTTANTIGTDVTIKTYYLFKSSLAMVAPGPGAIVKFGSAWLPGYSRQAILF